MRYVKTPMVAEQDSVCPKCGGELRFTSDRLGFGQTIEQCVNVLKGCGHWRTLEGFAGLPQHTRAPRGEGPRSRQKRMRRDAGQARAKTQVLLARLLEELPPSATGARTADELAAACRAPKLAIVHALRVLDDTEQVAKQPRRGRTGRPPFEYWRNAA